MVDPAFPEHLVSTANQDCQASKEIRERRDEKDCPVLLVLSVLRVIVVLMDVRVCRYKSHYP